MELSGLLKLTELGVDMQHKICDACETVAHCTKHGCIPLQPAQQKPLTDAEINQMCPQFEDPMRREMWITGFKVAFNIGK